jgi:hypothetical protein
VETATDAHSIASSYRSHTDGKPNRGTFGFSVCAYERFHKGRNTPAGSGIISYSHIYSVADGDRHGHTDTHIIADPHQHPNAHANTDANGCEVTDAYGHAEAVAYANAYFRATY